MKTISLIIVSIIAALIYGYLSNIYQIATVKEYKTLNVPNVVCGVGIFAAPVGAVCWYVR